MSSKSIKVFGIGLQKTGTSSLGRALEILGYKINHNFDETLAHKVIDKNFDEITEEVSRWDAFQDNPWPMVYKEMDERYPGSKFILTDRNIDSWFQSVLRHYGTKEYRFEKWFYGVNHPVGNEVVYKRKYVEHIKDVKEYFKNRKDDLLIVNWEEGHGWKELCSFLNKDIPEESFPHWNKNKTFKDRISKKIRRIKKRIMDKLSLN